MERQKGFTLIELMVVIVIIGILSALAIPKMFGTSAKAKAAEAPTQIASWETLQSAYSQESGTVGTFAQIGFQDPSAVSKWFDYTDDASVGDRTITASAQMDFGDCVTGDFFRSGFTVAGNVTARDHQGTCVNYTPNFE
jgi:prepilin-type N-terminal cleavage/methylation domain-containing protein